MNDEKKHMTNGRDNGDDFFRKIEIPYGRSKEEVWQQLSDKLEEKPAGKIVSLTSRKIIAGVAATLLLLIGLAGFMRYYKKSIEVPNGRHLSYALPDGSQVELNARTTLSYHPFWWPVSRTVELEGEAFFRVENGDDFRVISNNGTTEVVGTSFNIYSRNDDYRVACLSGKVKVTSPAKEEVILSPGYEAGIVRDGKIIVEKKRKPEETVSWTEDMFSFTGAPLMEVIAEIERQYDVTVLINEDPGLTYTGFFSRDKPVEEVLGLVSKPFGLTFVKRSEGVYQIVNNQ